jgi:alkanesulfonate monooxygenase SsuD/methylene tetrahydromethanopterin reductase-like flavin-dependent oxidoreductase (luciferase family)
MTDFGRELRFGYFLIPNADDPLLATAGQVDRLGLDYVAVQDHPYQRRFVDTWTLLSMVAATTSRVGVLPDVANLPLRPPLMLANQAATLDQLSRGRFELGLGAGAFWDGIRAMGGPVREPRQALAALREAITLLRAFFAGRPVRQSGEFYQAAGARPGPLPAHEIGIWLGVIGPRALRLTGELGDAWVPSMAYIPAARAAAGNAIIDEAARAAGRDPAAIRRIYNIGGEFAATVEAGGSDGDQAIVGPPDHWIAVLSRLALEQGFSAYVLWGEPREERLRRFIEEIAPAVRARVAEARR